MRYKTSLYRVIMCVLLSGGVSYAATTHKEASHKKEVAQNAVSSKASPLTLSGNYGAWSYRCAFSGEDLSSGPQSCVVQQTLMAQSGGRSASPVGMVILARSENEARKVNLSKRPWRLTVMAPLGLSLKKQPVISLGGQDDINLEWQSCVVTGCLASADLTSSQASALQKSHKGAFVAKKVLNGTLTIDFSLEGADKSMQKIDRWIAHPPLQ